MIQTDEHKKLLEELKKEIYPWGKYLIAVDGLTGSGKSGLSRYLALELDMPVIETDMHMDTNQTQPCYRLEDLGRLVSSRHKQNRPVIIEGIFLLDTLDKLGLEPDYMIYVKNSEGAGYVLRTSLLDYIDSWKPNKKANYIFNTDFLNV
jgi:uridine kinase